MIPDIKILKNTESGNFFLMAGSCVIENESMALEIAEKIVEITDRLKIPYIFKGSYRKANRSRIDSFSGIGDETALKILKKVGDTFHIPTITDTLVKRGYHTISIGKTHYNTWTIRYNHVYAGSIDFISAPRSTLVGNIYSEP